MACECSVVVPLYNEELNLPTLHLRLTAALRRLAIPYEIIYVDNGSADQTPALISELHAQDEAVKGIILSRRFSRQGGLCAGLEAANGRSVITIDGNLEDPPEVIGQLIEAWHEGYEVIFARRRRRKNSFYQILSSLCHYMLRLVSEVDIPTDIGELTLMDRRAVQELNRLSEQTRCITGLRSWVGFRQMVLEYDCQSGLSSASGSPVSRQVRTVLEGLLAFSNVPIKGITVIGCLVAAVALFGMIGSLDKTEISGSAGAGAMILGWALGILGGIQLMCLGVIGEYLSRVYREVRGRPLYVTRERIGFQPLPRPARNILQFLPSQAAKRQELATNARVKRKWNPAEQTSLIRTPEE
ncbi:MAG: glycosyltransferase family 2 protein [Phycisphaerales bacterium]|nr:MAG: glycosyltransferase family 2 protein [Phycisphaerales bacterium]